MNKSDFLAEEIFKRYGNVRRARGPFLYTSKNVRLTDLYQEAGRAVLGWGGSSAFTVLKNVLERGANGSFITGAEYRLEKAVSELFDSKRTIAVYYSKDAALKAGLALKKNPLVWIPWSFEKKIWSEESALVLEAPLPWTEGIAILALKNEDGAETEKKEFPEEGKIRLSSPLAEAATRSIYNMIAALQERQEKNWFIYDRSLTMYFERKGPWLFPKVGEEDYDDFMLHCLDCGIVISPERNQPSLVPFGADKGVFSKLDKNPFGGEK